MDYDSMVKELLDMNQDDVGPATPIRECLSLINGRTACAVITGDATYSLSPAMHNSAYGALGIADQFIYLAHSVLPSELPRAIEDFRSIQNYRGISVGVPHKQTVIPFLHRIDPAAEKIGAVNTIVINRENGEAVLTGYNTDWIGILGAFRERKIDLRGKMVTIIGAGGAARAAVYAVLREGATVRIYNRTPKRAKTLAVDFRCESEGLDKISEIRSADVVINATNLGIKPDDPLAISQALIKPHHILFDVVYSRNIPKTRLVKAAEQQGATVIQGREMLLWQGVEQFRLFTKQDAPIEVMRKAIL